MFNLSFLSWFGKQKEETPAISQDKVVLRMNRLLASESEVPLRELLQVVAVCFGECTLSIVYGKERSVLATTGSRDELGDIENVAYRVKDTESKEYYLRNEVNGLYFRKGMNCIRIFPFGQVVNESCFLMVEQESHMKGAMNIDRVIDFLSIAVRLMVLTKDRKNQHEKGQEILSRDEFMDCLRAADNKRDEKEMYIGMFYFANIQQLNAKEGVNGVEDAINGIASILSKAFPKAVCRISSTKFAVVICGEMYYVVCSLQDRLDEIAEAFPKANVKCVVTKVLEDIYRVMYLCEKASENISKDAVVVLREIEEELEDDVEETTFYQADEPEVVIDDASFREVEIDEDELEKAKEEFSSNAKEDREEKITREDFKVYENDEEESFFQYSESFRSNACMDENDSSRSYSARFGS